METPAQIEIHAAPHPDLEVHRAGFSLDHPYVEQCWTPILGPTSVLLLRRTTELWRDAMPARVDTAELAAQLGVSQARGQHSPITRTLDRVARFRFAAWAAPGVLDVYSEVRPLRSRELARVPDWSRARHEELLTEHLDRLQQLTSTPPPLPSPGHDAASDMVHRLDEFASSQAVREHTGVSR